MQLTDHFSLEELIASDVAARYGIYNQPGAEVLSNLEVLAHNLETARSVLGKPIHITSGYRCPELNTLVKGQPNSEHLLGLAADIISPQFGTPLQVCKALAESRFIKFNQIIHEFGHWCHLSVPRPGQEPKAETLTISRNVSLSNATLTIKGLHLI